MFYTNYVLILHAANGGPHVMFAIMFVLEGMKVSSKEGINKLMKTPGSIKEQESR